MRKANLYELDLPHLEDLASRWGYSRDSGRQIWDWLYRGAVGSVAEMSDLPGELVGLLDDEFVLSPSICDAEQQAPDGSARKYLLGLEDGTQIEVVLLHYRERRSGCISTQVGCACGCPFCTTGQMGFVRDLTAGEIVGQVMFLERALRTDGASLTNVVLMGMGEPLLNYDPTLEAVRRIVDRRGLGLPERRVTLSTVGIVPGIERLSRDRLAVKLAVSLHAASDGLRDQLVPVNRRYPLDALFQAIESYSHLTRRRVLLEWVMIEGVNDTEEQANALVQRVRGLPVHVNAIRLNATPAHTLAASPVERIDAFTSILDKHGVPHTLRQSRGASISAGCGQLRGARKASLADSPIGDCPCAATLPDGE